MCFPTGDKLYEHPPAPVIETTHGSEKFVASLADSVIWGYNRSKQINGLHKVRCLGANEVAYKFDYMPASQEANIRKIIAKAAQNNPDIIEEFAFHWEGITSAPVQMVVTRNIEFINRMAMR